MTTGVNGSVKDMTRGNPYWLILEFAFPVFLSQVFQQLYNTADTLIVGKFLGTEALAAVGSSGNLIFLLTSFFVGMSVGAGVVISKYFGAREYDQVSRAVHTTVVFGLLCGIFVTVVGVGLTPTILKWMDTDPDVMPQAIEYFRVYFLGVLAVVEYNNCKGIMNALGDSRRPLYYLVVSSVLNILLDLLFIGVFHWGVWSAAFATIISQAVSMILCFIHLSKKGTVYQLQWKRMRIHGRMLKEIVWYGLPAGLQNSVISVANVVIQTNINSFGKLATAAYGSYSKIQGFAFLPITSFTMALTTYTSQNLGAREYERAKKGSRFGILAAVVLAEVIGVVTYITAPVLMGWFSDNAEIIAIGTQQARTEALFYCFLAFAHAVSSVCRGAGKVFVPMFIMLSIWCVLRIAYITIVMQITHELRYIYWAYPLTWGISSILYFLYYHCSDWIHGFEHKKTVGA